MPYRIHSLAALTLTLLTLAAPPALGQETDGDSPIDVLRARRDAIVEAGTLEEVIRFVPENAVDRVRSLSDDEKAAALARWQEEQGRIRYVQERVRGERGVVHLEVADRDDGVQLVEMVRQGGTWTEEGTTHLLHAVPGARGSFALRDSARPAVRDGLIHQTWINGMPILAIEDDLAAALVEDATESRVQLAIEECFDAGPLPIGHREGPGVTVGSAYAGPADGGGEPASFDQESTGTLEVERVEGGRFSGTFSFTARDEAGNPVTVDGSIVDARVPCPEDPDPVSGGSVPTGDPTPDIDGR